ncbi:S-methyl-5'-thioadenosine phosphorylase [Novosphingobium sp. APW14]|jgi:5'-methylthioadenosine phosphorylase|uniref:S-methyl-5'-thioadenosine phosphorylase n=1 Tax=Novosphingobium sp. APW14 TaxID=3077237 RepID=UPI0028DF1B78|nr:S-methyl-5'-thioadenosine phosphorylase [Novosphingobium sp. APW14]MDT9013194.1 S-methyl-5'-thioadenosine phosphorylase [Novosphingobium sp. APW14]
MNTWHIGVIGGSGLAGGVGLQQAQEIAVESPFGEPSAAVTTGTLEGVRVTFLPRHGPGHAIPPASVNYRANIDVLKRCGVTDLIALSAIGSLRADMAPGQMVAVDQFIDRTVSRPASYFGPGLVAHVSLADPVCPRLAAGLADAVEAEGATVHRGGTYVAIEGPQFSTRAESLLYRQWGGDVIGMTAMPEVRLAREAELPYALLGMVTDYDAWRTGESGVEAAEVLAVMHANVALAGKVLRRFLAALPARREDSPIDRTLDHAIMTAEAARDPMLVAKLGAVAGRVLG